MQAINAAYALHLDGVTVARLAQLVENKVVGAPCGIMDQMSSALCVPNSLLLILCQPHEFQGTQALPDGVRVFGINSNVKHSVGGSAYTRARVAAFMGRKLLGADYLAGYSWSNLDMDKIPQAAYGEFFLERHGETGDTVTRVDPTVTYQVTNAIFHAIGEHGRVQHFVHIMSQPEVGFAEVSRAGSLMYESHRSYTSIGLGCEETDLLVEMGRAAGSTKGIYGAKITGGGSGGTVAFLTHGEQAEQTIQEIADAYRQQTGLTPQIFLGGLSPGAMAFGSETLK